MWRFLVILCLITISVAYSAYEQQEDKHDDDYDIAITSSGESDEAVDHDHRPYFADFGAQTGDFGAFSWHATYYDPPVVRRE